MKCQSCIVMVVALSFALPQAYCQWKELPSTGSPTERLPDRTTLAGQSGAGPLLAAWLVDEEKNAKQHKAIVSVQTDGVQLVDPAQAHNQPKMDQAHIQYRLDDGPVQNTTAKTWIFDQLSPGEHRIYVALATSDNHLIGKSKKLHVHVP
jgi:hypothetical protein